MADDSNEKTTEQKPQQPPPPPLPPPTPTFSIMRVKESDASQAELSESRDTKPPAGKDQSD